MPDFRLNLGPLAVSHLCLMTAVLCVSAPVADAKPKPARPTPVATPVKDITNPASLISPANPDAHPVPLDDLTAVRGGPEAVWTPDGKSIILSTNLTGRFNLWTLTEGEMMPVQLTQSDDRQGTLAVSLDGKTVYFSSDKGGREVYDLYSVPVAGGAATNLTRGEDISEVGLILSPVGKTAVTAIRRADASIADIGLVDLVTGTVRNLTHESDVKRQWSPAAFTPDGKAILAARYSADYTTSVAYLIDIASGKQTRLTDGKDSDFVVPAAVSPDGIWAAFSTTKVTGRSQAGLFNLATGQTRLLSPTAFEQSAVAFSPDSKSLVVQDNADGRVSLSLVDVTTLKATPLNIAPGYVGLASTAQSSFNPVTGQLLVNRDAGDSPFEYWIADPTGASPARQITHLAIASLNPANLPKNTIVHYKSFDGTPISAIVTLPFNMKRDGSNPVVLMPHGGPPSQSQDFFSKTVTALASRGYIVMQPNYRGSTGYGDPFMKANDRDFGGADVKDLVAGVDFLKSTGYVNPKKVAIIGGSYGGFLTLMALGKHPDVFSAGVDSYGIINWYTMYDNKEGGLHEYLHSKLGDPVADKAVYDAASPMTYAKNIRAPLLILQGENDARVPKNQAVEAAALIKQNGGVVETVFYPEEGHGFVKKENAADALRRTVDWLDRYVKGAG